jgi:serine/threonine-protein kinase
MFAPGGVVAGRFEILRQLGAGGLAEVFLAKDRTTGAEVALKALHAHLLFDEGLKERFRRELAVTRGLDHPGIVRVFDLHEHEGRPFFAMERLQGESLAEKLRAGPLPEAEAQRIAGEVCAALAVAHRAGVVHRDLKPQNIFLAETGEPLARVKVLDFGLARAAGWARLTAQSTVLGTPGYAAPEVIGGGGTDARADLYSLGATLFEMLTGKRAFPSSDPYEALRRQQGPPPAARKQNPAVSARADEVVRRSLEPDVENRFADAAQMGRALAGELPPQAVMVPPAMTSGTFQVRVFFDREVEAKEAKSALRQLVWVLGGEEESRANKRWYYRVATFGSAPLVAGCSRQTAQSIAALCQGRGIPASIEPEKPQQMSRVLRTGAVSASGLVLTTASQLLTASTMSMAAVVGLGVALTAGAGALAYFATARAPFADLPHGDPAVRRLLEGIVRRAARLRERQAASPEAIRFLLDDLERAAVDLVREATQLADCAAELPDALAPMTPLPGAPQPDAPTLISARKVDQRDGIITRLLEIAASLDEALAASSRSQESAQSALTHLREETEFARIALPQIDAALRGEEPTERVGESAALPTPKERLR